MKSLLRLAVVALILALPGCGESKVKITGKLTKNGQPMTVAKDTLVTLTFFPEAESKGQTYPARFKHETGEYEVEMPAGKYRVTYVIVPKDQAPLLAPPAMKEKSFDLAKNQKDLDIEIAVK